MTRRRAWLLCPLVLALFSCESPAPVAKKKEPEKPPEPVTARHAFQQMYAAARVWAPDLQIIQLASIPITDPKPENGKYGAWQAMFASPSKAKLKPYTYSVFEAGGNLHKGVFALPEESFSGSRGQAKPFLVQALKIDSDEAYKTAVEKSADFIKKNPDMPVMFLAEQTPRFPMLTWRVIWGESVSNSSYSVFVDATTGMFVAKAH